MKVRIQGNTFRFRLKQPELLRFSEERRIQERIEFGATRESCLTFALQIAGEENFRVSFDSNHIIFYLPSAVAVKWMSTNDVGFQEEVDSMDGRKIKLLVEKDFKCMEACAEDNAGAFEQPFH